VADDAEHARQQEEIAHRSAETTLADLHTAQGVMAGERGRPAEAVLWFAHAARLARGDPERQQDNRVRVRTWSRQAPVPVCALPHPGQALLALDFHPQGRFLLTLSRQERCIVWDLAEELPLAWAAGDHAVSAAAWSADGQWLALGTPTGEIEIRSFPGGELLHSLTRSGPIRALAVSADG
jgi:WD40 repeat protein